MSLTTGGKRTSEYSAPPKKKKKERPNPTRDLSAAGAFKNILKIATRAR